MQPVLMEPSPTESSAPEALPILYRDEHFVLVDKPVGLLVHRTPADREARHFALQTVRDQVGQHVYAVNRLDRATSGVLVFALSSEAAGALGTAFAERTVQKTYLAVVRGHPAESGVVDRALHRKRHDIRDLRNDRRRPPREAVTAYRRLATTVVPVQVGPYPESWYALVEARPQTGRKHQIRRHLRGIDHPIIGDTRYGDRDHNRYFADVLGCRRMLLHAVELAFTHPFSKEAIAVAAPLDAHFTALLDRFGWSPAVPENWREEERQSASTSESPALRRPT